MRHRSPRHGVRFTRSLQKKVGGSESEDRSFFLCAMVAFSKLSVMVAAPAAANQLFVAPAPYAAAPQARRQRTLSSLMCSIYCGIGFRLHGSERKCSIAPATDAQDCRQNINVVYMIFSFSARIRLRGALRKDRDCLDED